MLKEIIYDLIPTDRFITKNELIELVGVNEREIRRKIAEIRKEHNIISLSCQKGYKRAKSTDEMTQEEMKDMYETIKHQIAESNSRIKKLKYSMKMQIAYLKILEKNIK